VGYGGAILRTTDGGTTWVSQISGTTNWLYSVSFTDANTGTAVGDGGAILRTTDGGTTWVSQISRTGQSLYGVSFTDANTGTAVGDGGIILRTNTGGIMAVKGYGSATLAAGFSLLQNYPNPFNPSTTIRFTLAYAAFASLMVFNITGQEIATLVNKEMSPGTYEVTWHASGLPSGVYFYRLQTGSFMESKKLVLLR
jgi:hypothetical protein